MLKALKWSFRTGSLLVAAGCAASPASPPSATGPTTQQTAYQPPPAQPDLSVVSEPAELLGVVRFGNLRRTLEQTASVVGDSFPYAELLSLLPQAELFAVAKLDASFDCAVDLAPPTREEDFELRGACSIPVEDFQETRQLLDRDHGLLEIEPGVLRFRPDWSSVEDESAPEPSDTDPGEADDGLAPWADALGDELGLDDDVAGLELCCELSHALGDAPARIVCAPDEQQLDVLRPWLVRGLPLQSPGDAEVAAVLRVAPLQARYSAKLAEAADDFEQLVLGKLRELPQPPAPELWTTPRAVLNNGLRFFGDLDRLQFEGHLDEKMNELRFTGEVRFRRNHSWLTQLFTNAHARAGPVPELFWRLPKSSHSASYGRGLDRQLVDEPRRVAEIVLRELMDQTPSTPATRRAVLEFFRAIPMPSGPAVSAQGNLELKNTPPSDKPTPRAAIARFRALADLYAGWMLVGLEGPAADYQRFFAKTVALYQAVEREYRSATQTVSLETDLPRLRLRRHPPGFARGATELELKVFFDSEDVWEIAWPSRKDDAAAPHPETRAAKGSITLSVVAVPDGPNRTWIGVSTSRKALARIMRAVLQSRSSDDTLASLPSVQPLRATPATAGGWMAYGEMLKPWLDYFSQSASADATKFYSALVDACPHGLRAPMLYTVTGKAGPRPLTQVDWRIPRETLRDLIGALRFVMSDEGRALLETMGQRYADESGPATEPAP